MKSLIVHPENKDQLKALKAVMKVMKITFVQQGGEHPAGLSTSLKSGKKNKTTPLKFIPDDFIPEKSADEINEELKNSRKFIRKIESF